jgi:hypothetical protein
MASLPDPILSCSCSGRWRLFEGCEAPRAWIFSGELTIWIPTLPNLVWGKLFLPWDSYPLAESSWHLGVYSWSSCYVRRRWDGFCTWVRTDGCVWVPAPTSLRVRRLRPPLPKAPWLAMLIRYGKPPCTFDQGPGPCPESTREAVGVDRWQNPICPH